MAKTKTLTIYNSDRYFNIGVKDKTEIHNAVKVTRLNEEEIEAEMDKLHEQSSRYLKKDSKRYMLFDERYNNDKLIEKLCKHAGYLYYYTESTIPYYIFKELSAIKESSVIYRMKSKFSDKEIDNIALSFMGTKVIIDISVVLPNVNPYHIIRSLHDLKTNVDEVHLTFPRLQTITEQQKKFYTFDGEAYVMKPEYKVDFAEHIRVSLSVWKMYLFILVDETDKQEVTEQVDRLKKDKKVKI